MKHNQPLKRAVLSSAILVALAGCGSDDNYAPEISSSANIAQAQQWRPVEGQVDATDPNGDSLTYSAEVVVEQGQTAPGTVTIDDNGRFVYTPLSTEPATLAITVSDGELSTTTEIQVSGIQGDPLAAQQWHLRNTGQRAFAMTDSAYEAYRGLAIARGASDAEAEALYPKEDSVLVPGEDLNVIDAYAQGATGNGAISVVVDSGLAIAHEDLRNNVLPGRSINFDPFAIDRTDPTAPGDGGDHGTSVAGLIAAEAWNGLGGHGVSPEAKLIGMNFLGDNSPSDDRVYMAIHGMAGSGITPSDNVVTFNRSYGISYPLFVIGSEIDDAMVRYPTEVLRQGKGALNIKSNGNGFDNGDEYAVATAMCELQQATIPKTQSEPIVLSCNDGNWEFDNASFHSLSIGAVNSDGAHTSYSTAGANLWVSSPAGEYGLFYPAMVTTDQTTCTRGYSSWAAIDSFVASVSSILVPLNIDPTEFFIKAYPFDSPGTDANLANNAQCNYTSTFNGTSSAAPNTSGVVNLIASANPELNWREIRHILAVTATTVSPDDPAITLTLPDGEFVAHDGWVENAAGYSFNNLFGYGRPNAGAAVELAKSGEVQLPNLVETEWRVKQFDPALSIPDNSAAGRVINVEVTDDLTIEGIQFAFAISNPAMAAAYQDTAEPTTAASDIGIEVISPSGTRSVLATSRSALGALEQASIGLKLGDGDAESAINEAYLYNPFSPILTNAFYGETAKGTWTIRIVDTNGEDLGEGLFVNNTVDSTLSEVRVRVYGH